MSNYNGRKAKSWRNRRHLAGGESVLADAEPLRPIILELRSRMSWSSVAHLCGTTSHRHMREIADGTIKRVNHDLAQRIREASGKTPEGGSRWVNARGARRRTQALCALGYSIAKQARESGCGERTLKIIINGRVDSITADTDQLVRRMYDRLCMVIPAASDANDQGGITRARKRAEAEGWSPPLAWDDIDRDALPAGSRYGAQRAQVAEQDATYTDDEARKAWLAYRRGDTSDWAYAGYRVAERRRRRAQKTEAAA